MCGIVYESGEFEMALAVVIHARMILFRRCSEMIARHHHVCRYYTTSQHYNILRPSLHRLRLVLSTYERDYAMTDTLADC